jgi:hypothetical protein
VQPLSILARKLWGKLVEQARRLRGIAALERDAYGALEASLLYTATATDPRPRLPLPPAPVIRGALAAGPGYRCIDLRAPDADDRALLARHGLTLRLAAANRGLLPLAALPPGRGERRQRLGIADDPDLTGFQLEAVDQRAVEALCPVTGRVRRSVHGLLAAQNQPIFYWFPPDGPAPALLLATGREGRGWIKLYLYLPALRLALLLAEPARWHGRDEIDELRAYAIAEHRQLWAYLRRAGPPRPWVLLDNVQFAHHLWNALSGLERLAHRRALLQRVGLAVCAEPWGPPEALFPELAEAAGRPERTSCPALTARALADHRLLLRIGGTRICDELVARLKRLTAVQAPGAMAQAAALRRDHRPILWVTLRMENRTWVSQVPGLIDIGRRLARDFEAAAMIIDGFSVPAAPSKLPRAQRRLIEAERAAAAEIAAALADRLTVFSLIGRPLLEIPAFAPIADCYLAHHGSIQHKIGWLGQCPGLVHGNRTVLTTPMLWEAACSVREGQIQPSYLGAELVRDVPGAKRVAKNRWLDDLDNYELDAAAVYERLKPLLAAARGGERRG